METTVDPLRAFANGCYRAGYCGGKCESRLRDPKKKVPSPCSWPLEESQVESCEHQDNANVHCQAFPESISEEREINTDDDGCHCQDVKRAGDVLAHFSLHDLFSTGKSKFRQNRIWPGSVSRSQMHQDDPLATFSTVPSSEGGMATR